MPWQSAVSYTHLDVYQRQGEGQRVPGFRVQAVDTIAAGDTFNGALITALLEEKPLPEAIRFAHAAAAIAVTRKGAQDVYKRQRLSLASSH